jgi:hypothetical protein
MGMSFHGNSSRWHMFCARFWTGNGREKMEKRKTGIGVERRENWTGFGAVSPFSRPLPFFFFQTSGCLTNEEILSIRLRGIMRDIGAPLKTYG